MTILIRSICAISMVVYAITTVYSSPILHRTKRWEEFPNVTFTFNCSGRPQGFYADMEFDCGLFHYCDSEGRRIPHMCGNNTIFNQRYRNCDWPFNVRCKNSSNWFFLNELTYATDPPVDSVEISDFSSGEVGQSSDSEFDSLESQANALDFVYSGPTVPSIAK